MRRLAMFVLLITAIVIPVGALPKEDALHCRNQLKQIAVHVHGYKAKFETFPESFKDLHQKGLAEDESLFCCQVSEKPDPYTFIPPVKGDQTKPDAIIAHDTHPHPDGTRSALTFTGSVYVFDAEDFAVATKDGAKAARPRISVTSAKVQPTKDGFEAVIEGTITNLRSREIGGKQSVGADLKLRFFGEGNYLSAPQHFEGPAVADGLPFRAVLKLGAEDPGKNVAVLIDGSDPGRVECRFTDHVAFDSVGTQPGK